MSETKDTKDSVVLCRGCDPSVNYAGKMGRESHPDYDHDFEPIERDQHSYGACQECGNRILEEEGGYAQSNDTGAKAHTWCAKGKAEYYP